ncbi:MAG: hypothetical protein WBD10_01420 [Acidobacteriaceae bacterium]
MPSSYPDRAAARDRWILAGRGPRAALNPFEPYAFFSEEERATDGEILPVATILLTNRECPFHCVMCDLWRNTLTESVPQGAIPKQIEFALERMSRARMVKLYNSGSFFDPAAIPVKDYAAIAERVQQFERVIVECHPAFLGRRCVEFRDLLDGKLEVAMGLETAHPTALNNLNKRMTLEQFAEAASFLRRNSIDLRVFILVQPPFIKPAESVYWVERSLEFAFDCGATVVTLIPTRGGNGAMEALAADGEFIPPNLSAMESAMDYGMRLGRGRIFADLWDIRPESEKACCFDARVNRLRAMNMSQRIPDAVHCERCETS